MKPMKKGEPTLPLDTKGLTRPEAACLSCIFYSEGTCYRDHQAMRVVDVKLCSRW